MTDPERFRTNGSDLQRQLFASLEDDAPPAGAKARMLASLGAAAVLGGTEGAAAATAAGKGTPGLGWLAIAKWMAAGAATAVVTVGTGVAISTGARSIPSAPVRTAPAHATGTEQRSPSATPPAPDPRLGAHDRTEGEAVAETRGRPGTAAPPAAHLRPVASGSEAEAPRASAVVNAPPPSDLAREVALLGDVQKTLDGGDPRGAMRRLDLFAAAFPAPTLGPEATLLRVQALLASGDRSGAEALGRAFIAHDPHSQHAERIQSLLAAAVAPAGRLSDQKSRSGTQPER